MLPYDFRSFDRRLAGLRAIAPYGPARGQSANVYFRPVKADPERRNFQRRRRRDSIVPLAPNPRIFETFLAARHKPAPAAPSFSPSLTLLRVGNLQSRPL